jgi:hypothetical protein
MQFIHVKRGLCRCPTIFVDEEASATCMYVDALLFSLTKRALQYALYTCKESCM